MCSSHLCPHALRYVHNHNTNEYHDSPLKHKPKCHKEGIWTIVDNIVSQRAMAIIAKIRTSLFAPSLISTMMDPCIHLPILTCCYDQSIKLSFQKKQCKHGTLDFDESSFCWEAKRKINADSYHFLSYTVFYNEHSQYPDMMECACEIHI